MIQMIQALQRARRRLDRRRTGAGRVLADMQRRGLTLHFQFSHKGPIWLLSDSTKVSSEVARIMTANPAITAAGDTLFPHSASSLSQTWRWAGN
jgi:hypothetical protein